MSHLRKHPVLVLSIMSFLAVVASFASRGVLAEDLDYRASLWHKTRGQYDQPNKWTDTENGVVCYETVGGRGMSCLQTRP